MKLLGPLTKRLLKLAVKSGPRLKWMLSSPNGSSGTVLTSPKSPVANLCRSPLIMFNMHSPGRGSFREHVFTADARNFEGNTQIEN